jgi:hypothetical protein
MKRSTDFKLPLPIAASLGAILFPSPFFLIAFSLLPRRVDVVFAAMKIAGHFGFSFVATMVVIGIAWFYRQTSYQKKTRSFDLGIACFILLVSSAAYFWAGIDLLNDPGPF